jgi:hypothetical protein
MKSDGTSVRIVILVLQACLPASEPLLCNINKIKQKLKNSNKWVICHSWGSDFSAADWQF